MNLLIIGVSLAGLLGGAPSEGVEEKDLGLIEIREPNNPPDENGYGTVAYAYRITRDQISHALYARFLNAADPEGANTRELYHPGMTAEGGIAYAPEAPAGRKYSAKPEFQNRPVGFVNWRDAARFANWIRNGGRRGSSTEIGAYNLRAPQGDVKTRRGAYWVPCENEIYKAGFYLPLGRGRAEGDSLYARPATGLTDGALRVAVWQGWIPEIVDPAIDPPRIENPTVWFAGRARPEAETRDVGFRLAAALTTEWAEETEAEGDVYAGAPDLEEFPLFPLFFGFGSGGGGSRPSVLPNEPPPAS